MRMATLMRLHREETYALPMPTPELIMQAESARRTLVGDLALLREDDDLSANFLLTVDAS